MIKLVVLNNHTLGYIIPEIPNCVQVLHSSIIKGATNNGYSVSFNSSDSVELASEKDFEEFRVCFDGYKNDKNYEYRH